MEMKCRSKTENILNKIIEKNFPNLKKEMPIKAQEASRRPNRLDQKRKACVFQNLKENNILED